MAKEGLGCAMDQPLLMIFAPVEKKNRDIMFQLLEGLLVLPCEVVVLSDEDVSDDTRHQNGKITWVNSATGEKTIEKYFTAADMALFFEEHMSLLQNILDHGIVPVGHEKSPLLSNYHPNEETGNSFTFASYNPWDIFKALVRAHETYRFPYDWGNVVRGMVKK